MSQQHSQIQTQQQVQGLLPQQVLEVRLLELPTLAFEERVKAELYDNPALEEGSAEPLETSFEEQGGEGSSADDYLTPDDMPDFMEQPTRRGAAEIPFSDTESFYQMLTNQIGELKLDERTQQLVTYLIGSLDDDGLLRKPLSLLAEELCFGEGIDVTDEELLRCVKIVQTFEPIGIGAQTLQECLLLQLQRREATPYTTLATKVVQHYFDDFTHKWHDRLKQRLKVDDDTYRQVWEVLTHLNPRPGSPLNEVVGFNTQQVTPDFIVETLDDGTILFNLNNSNIPELRISAEFQQLIDEYSRTGERTKQAREAMLFVKQKSEAAKGFIEAIRVRNQTMYRVMKAIIELQHPFFVEGDERLLRPMILKDVAEVTGYDVSTISRVSNSKYVQTNYNIYPLRFFFSDGVTTADGEELTVRELLKVLKQLVESEDKAAPLSDERLGEELKAHGFTIARRTVAKYREQLGIPVARLRKD